MLLFNNLYLPTKLLNYINVICLSPSLPPKMKRAEWVECIQTDYSSLFI